MFSAEYEKQPLAFLKKLRNKVDVRRIIERIEKLLQQHFPSDAKRVEGFSDAKVFRVRVGDYRILYIVDFTQSKIFIIKIDRREKVYD